MSNSGEKSANERSGPLAAAIREVKNAAADRADVVIEMREAERMRLELLAAELGPVIADVPKDLDVFDFAISSGLQPRFWIDAISHVSMGRDKRTFRFVRDTRLGRVVVAESSDMKAVSSHVTNYIAERMVERQRLLEGDVAEVKREATTAKTHLTPDAETETVNLPAVLATTPPESVATADVVDAEKTDVPAQHGWGPFLSGLGMVLLGALAAGAVTASYYWDQIDWSRLGLERFGL